MKKFGKFIFGTLSIASLAAGAYYVYKNFIKNDPSDDFDEFEDDFDEFEDDFDIEEETGEINKTREYVSIPIVNGDTNNKPEETDDESSQADGASDEEETENQSSEEE